MTRRGALAAALVLLVVLVPAATAAAKRTGSFTTPGCKGAPTWKIGYRFYFNGAGGATTPRGRRARLAKSAARKFARQVGRFSRCGVRVRVDFYDEGDAVFDRAVDSYGLSKWPRDARSFRKRHGYDAVFYRYPWQDGDAAPGYTGWLPGGVRGWGQSGFPVDESQPETPDGRPWRNLVLHEWLHIVVDFYAKANWMRELDPVHAGCSIEPYATKNSLEENDGPCIASGTYFRDLMRGEVLYKGARYGITRSVWRRCGTPTRPPKRHRRRCF